MATGKAKSVAGKHGERMIEVKVRFWTNDLAPKADAVLQKHGWSSGVVRVEVNSSHAITPRKARPFNSLLDVGAAIEKVLIDHGIVLHPSRRMRKYLYSE